MIPTEYTGYGWEMMPWYGMVFGPVMMIIMIVILVILIRSIGGGMCGTSNRNYKQENSALDILEERFAKGEIDKQEFEEKKKILTR